MTKVSEHRKALKLRNQGRSYNQIRKKLNLSKSTLSAWLRERPLSKEQLKAVRRKGYDQRIEKFRSTMQKKRERRLLSYYKEEKSKWLPFSEREFFLTGLFLYWGEGNKASRNTVSLNNTDPCVVNFALKWINYSLNIPKERIKICIHLYKDMNIPKEIRYWSKILGISPKQFLKPYIKKSKRVDLDQKGFGHGTCGVMVHDTVIKEKILMAIKVVSDQCLEKNFLV